MVKYPRFHRSLNSLTAPESKHTENSQVFNISSPFQTSPPSPWHKNNSTNQYICHTLVPPLSPMMLLILEEHCNYLTDKNAPFSLSIKGPVQYFWQFHQHKSTHAKSKNLPKEFCHRITPHPIETKLKNPGKWFSRNE